MPSAVRAQLRPVEELPTTFRTPTLRPVPPLESDPVPDSDHRRPQAQGFGRRAVAVAVDVPEATPVPPSERTLCTLALIAFEALEGMRSIAQLGPWITTAVAQQLRERRAARRELRTLTRDERRTVTRPGRAHTVRTGGAIEAVVVLHAAARATAVALRMEVVGGRWRATDLVVL